MKLDPLFVRKGCFNIQCQCLKHYRLSDDGGNLMYFGELFRDLIFQEIHNVLVFEIETCMNCMKPHKKSIVGFYWLHDLKLFAAEFEYINIFPR